MKKFFEMAYLTFKYVCILFGGMLVSGYVARKVVFDEEKED